MNTPKCIRTLTILWAVTFFLLIGIGATFAQEHVAIKSYPAGSFATGWTHITYTPYGLFYYNSQTGSASVGQLDNAGNHTTIKSYPAATFSLGWTYNVYTPNGILWYYSPTGGGLVGQIR